jgi:HEAT repeat protein
MSIYHEFDDLDLKQLIALFQKKPLYGEDDPYFYYTEIASLIEEQGEEGLSFLRQELTKVEEAKDAAKLVGILFALVKARPDGIALRDRLLDYLRDSRWRVVLEAIEGLGRLGEKDAIDQVLPLLEHPSPYVQGSVLRFMGRLHSERARPLLIEALKHPHFIVRESAVDELSDLEDAAAIPDLRPLLKDPHPDVRQAAETTIGYLEGKSIEEIYFKPKI